MLGQLGDGGGGGGGGCDLLRCAILLILFISDPIAITGGIFVLIISPAALPLVPLAKSASDGFCGIIFLRRARLP